MQRVSQSQDVVILVRGWPGWAKILCCSAIFPTMGYVCGAIVATWFMNLSDPVTLMSWLVFCCPTAVLLAVGLKIGKPQLALIGIAPQPAVLVLICLINHASAQRALAFWPAVFPSMVGPLLGLVLATRVHQGIASSTK